MPKHGTDIDFVFEDFFDRRKSARTHCNRGGLIGVSGLKRLFFFTVQDASELGIGMRLHSTFALLPIEFVICAERLLIARRCRLAWRKGDVAGAEFADQT
jgi:hypothetical protein